MYIDSTVGWATDAIRERLTQLEAELSAPIRVYGDQLRNSFVAPDWSVTHIRNSGYTVAQGQESGITIATYATTAHNHRWSDLFGDVPGTFFEDGDARYVELYDQIMPGGNSDEPTQYLDDDVYHDELLSFDRIKQFVEVKPRLVVFNSPINQLASNYAPINFELFEGYIRMSADPEFVTNMEAARARQEQVRWDNWCDGARDRALGSVRQQIEQQERVHAVSLQQMAGAIGSLQGLRAQVEALEASLQRNSQQWRDLWDALERHPRITHIGFDMQSRLTLTTDTMTMSHPDHGSRTLGRFKITFTLDGARNLIFENLDYKRNGRHHPHIPADGNACFGEAGATIAKYLGELQLIGLVEILIQFLESFNPNDDWGRHAAMWFDMPDALDDEAETDNEAQDAEPAVA